MNERKKKRKKEERPIPFMPSLRNIGTPLPLRTIHNRRRPIDLLRARGAKEGRPGATVLTQVEIDIDICNATIESNQPIFHSLRIHLTFLGKLDEYK